MAPSIADSNGGRDVGGRFASGNRFGRGRPYANLTARLRRVALDAVSETDVAEIIKALAKTAKSGDVPSAKLLLSLLFGRVSEPLADSDVALSSEEEAEQLAAWRAKIQAKFSRLPEAEQQRILDKLDASRNLEAQEIGLIDGAGLSRYSEGVAYPSG